MTVDTDALRDALEWAEGEGYVEIDAARDTLDSLVAELERVKIEVIDWKMAKADSDRQLEEAVGLLNSDELERVKAERDGAIAWRTEIANTAGQFEARLDKALAALRGISDRGDFVPFDDRCAPILISIARAAIAEIEEVEPPPPDPRLVKRLTSDGTQMEGK